jgi:hypothetical protein
MFLITTPDWARRLAKQRQDAAENITGDVVLPPAQSHSLKKKKFHIGAKGSRVVTWKSRPFQLLGKRAHENTDDLRGA